MLQKCLDVKFKQHKCLPTKQSSSGSRGTRSSLHSRDLLGESFLVFFLFFSFLVIPLLFKEENSHERGLFMGYLEKSTESQKRKEKVSQVNIEKRAALSLIWLVPSPALYFCQRRKLRIESCGYSTICKHVVIKDKVMFSFLPPSLMPLPLHLPLQSASFSVITCLHRFFSSQGG